MFKLINGGKTDETKVQKGLRRMGVSLLQQAADMALLQTGQALLHYTRQGDPRFLDEAEESAAALLAAIRELKSRRDGPARP